MLWGNAWETHGNLGNKMRVSSQTLWQPVLGGYKFFSIFISFDYSSIFYPSIFIFLNKKITCNIL